ncbi:unnamed protein product [Victoria cruziana]
MMQHCVKIVSCFYFQISQPMVRRQQKHPGCLWIIAMEFFLSLVKRTMQCKKVEKEKDVKLRSSPATYHKDGIMDLNVEEQIKDIIFMPDER